MRQVKSISILLAIILLLGIVAGCGLVQVNPEKDRSQVVAEVNGEKILKGEVLDRLDRDKAYYNLTDEDINNKDNKEMVLEVKKTILDQIATEKLLLQKASEAGIEVNDQIREEARKELEDIKKDLEDQIRRFDEEEAEDEEDEEDEEDGKEPEEKNYEQEAHEYINEQLAAMGMTEGEYIEFLAQQKCIEKLYERTVEDVQVPQEEVDQFYNEELTMQKENIALIGTRPVTLYEPPKVRVKHIAVEIPSQKTSEYQDLMKEEKEDEAKELLDKELEAIKDHATEILNKAKAGEEFEKLVEEVNPDLAEVMEEGITTHKENYYLPDEYLEVAFQLKEGEISDLVSTPYGYYIIKLEEKYPEKTYTLEEKKEDIEEQLKSEKRQEKWEEILSEWKDKSVKVYEKRL
jgi:foldase protein PrsA